MKKFVIQIVALIILILGAFAIVSNPVAMQRLADSFSRLFFGGANKEITTVITQARVKDAYVNVTTVSTPEDRAKGLGGVESLASDSGMLFTYPQAAQYQFWMKGMLIPIDIIWINQGKVVDISANLPPPAPNQPDSSLPLYSPKVPAEHVLEVNAGWSAQNGIQDGDPVLYFH